MDHQEVFIPRLHLGEEVAGLSCRIRDRRLLIVRLFELFLELCGSEHVLALQPDNLSD